jgi:hypothetical protein
MAAVPMRNEGSGESTRITRAVKRTRTASVSVMCGGKVSVTSQRVPAARTGQDKRKRRARSRSGFRSGIRSLDRRSFHPGSFDPDGPVPAGAYRSAASSAVHPVEYFPKAFFPKKKQRQMQNGINSPAGRQPSRPRLGAGPDRTQLYRIASGLQEQKDSWNSFCNPFEWLRGSLARTDNRLDSP